MGYLTYLCNVKLKRTKDMKEYAVNVDITMSKTIYVKAKNEEEAKQLANAKVFNDPYEEVMSGYAVYVTHEIIDAYEVED